MTGRLHDGQAEIDSALVKQLLDTQLPELSDLPITEVRSTGTVNAIYRLGSELCVRLPLMRKWADDLSKELDWLPRLARHLRLAVPKPVARGEAGHGYPYSWAVYRWIEGRTFAPDRVDDERRAASDLAEFITDLRQVDPSGAPRSGRKPLAELDPVTRAVIRSLRGTVDPEVATFAWEIALHAPEWDGRGTWIHCDLLPPNLIVDHRQLRAVIDFGASGVGDPAQDLTPAWSVFGESARQVFRDALDVDDGTWMQRPRLRPPSGTPDNSLLLADKSPVRRNGYPNGRRDPGRSGLGLRSGTYEQSGVDCILSSVEPYRPSLHGPHPQHVHRVPGVVTEATSHLGLVDRVDDQQSMLTVVEWTTEHDEPVVDQAIHERTVLRECRLVADRLGFVPLGTMDRGYGEVIHVPEHTGNPALSLSRADGARRTRCPPDRTSPPRNTNEQSRREDNNGVYSSCRLRD